MKYRRTLLSITLALGIAALAAPSYAQTQQQAAAQAHFNKGRDLFIASDYARAIVEFRAATELVESPNTRLYIARCEKELGHLARAYVEYQRAATEAADRADADSRYASTRDAARQEGDSLGPKLAHVTLGGKDLPADTTIEVAGESMGVAALGVSVPVDAGKLKVVARAKGYKSFQKTVEVGTGEDIPIEVKLEADPSAGRSSAPANDAATGDLPTRESPDVRTEGGGVRIGGFIVGGLGVVGVGMFGAFAIQAQNQFNTLRSACDTHCLGPAYQSQIDGGKQSQLIANVSLGAGAALLVAGAIMIAAGGPKVVTGKREEVTRVIPLFGPSPDGHGASLGVLRAF